MANDLVKVMGGRWVMDYPGGPLHFLPTPIRRNHFTLYDGMTVAQLREQLAGMPDDAALGTPVQDSTPVFRVKLNTKKERL